MQGASGLGSLTPWSAHLCLRVERIFLGLCGQPPAGSRLILAVSGGLDSTALAAIMAMLAPRLGVELSAAHVDHGLRPESADDATFCVESCARLGLECAVARADIREQSKRLRTGIEDAGRQYRYAWLEELRLGCGAFAVLTAHQLDELAEDVLMRLLRGAGWPALGGMHAWDAGRRVLRPLLTIPKAHLRRFLEEGGIPWREDPSNSDQAFLRNRIRNDFMPLFARENPDFLSAVAELWTQARLDEKFHDDSLLGLLEAALTPDGGLLLRQSVLEGLHPALRVRLYKRAVEALGPGQPLAAPLRALDDAWRNRSTGKVFQFPGGKAARVLHEGIAFAPGAAPADVDTSLPEG